MNFKRVETRKELRQVLKTSQDHLYGWFR